MTDIPKQTLSELINNIKTKKISSEEATKAFIERSEKSKNLMLIFLKIMKMQLKKQKYLIKNQTLKKNYLVYLLP